MLGNLIAKILSGSAVGYITNYLAIQMLFQEYFKIRLGSRSLPGLGGVIIKERAEFESQISHLVERDVIHHRALEEQIRKPEFGQILAKMIEGFLEIQLMQSLGDDKVLEDIPGLDQTYRKLKEAMAPFLAKFSKELIEASLPDIMDHRDALLHPLQNFLEVSLQKSGEGIASTDFANWHSLWQSWMELCPQDVLGEAFVRGLDKGQQSFFKNFHENLRHNYDASLKQLIEKAHDALDLRQLCHNIAEALAQKNLKDIFGEQNLHALPEGILQEVQALLDSEVGEDVVRILLKYLLNVLHEEDSSLFELISDDLKLRLEAFIADQLPDLMETLIQWIRERKFKLELLIDKAFEANANNFGRFLVQLLIGSVGKYVGIEKKLIGEIEKRDPKELSQQLSDQLNTFLQENSIGEIIQRFDSQKIVDSVSPILLNSIRETLPGVKTLNLSGILNQPLGSWISAERLDQALWNQVEKLLRTDWKEKWLYQESSSRFLRDFLHKQIHIYATKPLKESLGEDASKLSLSLQKRAAQYLQDEKESISRYLLKEASQYLQTRFSASEQEVLLEQLPELNAWLLLQLDEQWESLQNKAVKELIESVPRAENWENRLSDTLKAYLIDNLPDLMKGRVEALVQDNLAKQPDTKLRDMVHKAMGEELKPLSYFGAILGTIAAILIWVFPPVSDTASNFIISGLAFGITGWATNWLAIRMLFRPYNPVMVLGGKVRLPFTPGVVARYKARFAKSMGRFIGDRLLNEENLRQSFSRKREDLEARIKTEFRENDFQKLKDLLHQQEGRLSTWAQEKSMDFLRSDLEKEDGKIALALKKYLKNPPLDKIEPSLLAEQLLHLVQDPEQVQALLSHLLEPLLKKDAALEDWMPERLQENLQIRLQSLLLKEGDKLIRQLDRDHIMDWIKASSLIEKMEEWLQQNIKWILNLQQEHDLKERIFAFITEKLKSQAVQDQVFDAINGPLSKEFGQEKPLKELFGGRWIPVLESNLNRILEGIIHIAVQYLKDNRDSIADKVYQDAANQSSLAWTFKNAIKGGTYELIDHGIPEFLSEELDSLQGMIRTKIKSLEEQPLVTNQLIALNHENLRLRIGNILENFQLQRKVRQLTNLLLEERIFAMPLKRFIRDDASTLLENISNFLDPELELIRSHGLEKIHTEAVQAELIAPLSKVLWQILSQYAKSLRPSSFEPYFPPHYVEILSQNLHRHMVLAPAFQDFLIELMPQTLDIAQAAAAEPGAHLDAWNAQLRKVLLLCLEKHQESIQHNLSELVGKGLQKLPEALAPEALDSFMDTLSQAAFNTLETHLLDLIHSISFKEIVVREIAQMHAQQLEKLFYGFARKYFKYLIGYGFAFGLILGILIDYVVYQLISQIGIFKVGP